MIEMRWLERTVELRIPFSLLSYSESEKVLQYREMVDSTWSKWQDVPTVRE